MENAFIVGAGFAGSVVFFPTRLIPEQIAGLKYKDSSRHRD
jgi:hypothetical protein